MGSQVSGVEALAYAHSSCKAEHKRLICHSAYTQVYQRTADKYFNSVSCLHLAPVGTGDVQLVRTCVVAVLLW